jgi:hypothetical protein
MNFWRSGHIGLNDLAGRSGDSARPMAGAGDEHRPAWSRHVVEGAERMHIYFTPTRSEVRE